MRFWTGLAISLAVLSGCGKTDLPPKSDAAQDQLAASEYRPAKGPSKLEAVSLRQMTVDELNQFIASQKKIVVMDAWATY